jgi:hypothetical protein
MALRKTSESRTTAANPHSLTSVLTRPESQEADDVLLQAKGLENLSGSPRRGDSCAYFREFGRCFVDIDANIGRFGQ